MIGGKEGGGRVRGEESRGRINRVLGEGTGGGEGGRRGREARRRVSERAYK